MSQKKTYGQLCDTCDNACGGCCWTELGEDGKPKHEPVPGWTADLVPWKPFRSRATEILSTYQIHECPLYIKSKNESPPKKHLWTYTKPIMSVDMYTGEVIVFETIDCVVRAGFDVQRAKSCLLSKYKASHKGNRFFPAPEEYIQPCMICPTKKKKKCMQVGGTCKERESFVKARQKDGVRIVPRNG